MTPSAQASEDIRIGLGYTFVGESTVLADRVTLAEGAVSKRIFEDLPESCFRLPGITAVSGSAVFSKTEVLEIVSKDVFASEVGIPVECGDQLASVSGYFEVLSKNGSWQFVPNVNDDLVNQILTAKISSYGEKKNRSVVRVESGGVALLDQEAGVSLVFRARSGRYEVVLFNVPPEMSESATFDLLALEFSEKYGDGISTHFQIPEFQNLMRVLFRAGFILPDSVFIDVNRLIEFGISVEGSVK